MVLKGEIGTLEIDVLSRTNSSSNDFWEANWLYSSIKGDFPGFKVNFNTNLRTDDFKRCFNGLQDMLSFKCDNAKFLTLEEGLSIDFDRDNGGSYIMVKGKLTAVDLTNCSLEFNFNTDNLTVENFVLQISELLDKYPIIGTP